MTDTNEEEILNLEYILSTDKTTTKRSHGSLRITFLRVVDDVFFFNRQNRLNTSNRILNNKNYPACCIWN